MTERLWARSAFCHLPQGMIPGMKPMTRSYFVTAMLAGALVAAMPPPDRAFADKKGIERGEEDHEEAFRARQGGAVLPLAEVLAMVRPEIDGEIIETDFEYEHDIPVYEFKYVNRQGQVRELYADARNGAVLKDKPD